MKSIRKYIFLPLCFLLFAFLFHGCAKEQITKDADRSFRQFTSELFRQDVAVTTLSLHYTLENPALYGIETFPITFGDFQPQTSLAKATIENLEASLAIFPYQALSKENQLTYDILSAYIDDAKEGLNYSYYEEPLNSVTGIQAQLPILLAEYRFTKKEDIDIYLQLLSTFPTYFESLITYETERAARGWFMDQENAEKVIRQCEAFRKMEENNYLLTTFSERLKEADFLTDSQRKAYEKQNKIALTNYILPAYDSLISSLHKLQTNKTNSGGLCNLPNGKSYYAYLLRQQTGSSRSVEAIESLIQSQMAEDLLAMQKIVEREPAIAKQDSVSLPTNPEIILQNLQMKMQQTFPTPPKVSVTVKQVPKSLEPYLSPAFYLIPPIDNSTSNVIYMNTGQITTDLNLFTTLAHEGYPGHLYQTTYFASTNPDPVRYLFSYGGYTEGWATYAEMCSYSLSPLPSSSASLLQKNSSLLLGLYAACDIKVHYYGWNLTKIGDFLATYGIDNPETIKEIYTLLLADPANYPKYYVGYLEFLELKKEAMRTLANDFSQRNFHQSILKIGPAPFSILRKYLLP